MHKYRAVVGLEWASSPYHLKTEHSTGVLAKLILHIFLDTRGNYDVTPLFSFTCLCVKIYSILYVTNYWYSGIVSPYPANNDILVGSITWLMSPWLRKFTSHISPDIIWHKYHINHIHWFVKAVSLVLDVVHGRQ